MDRDHPPTPEPGSGTAAATTPPGRHRATHPARSRRARRWALGAALAAAATAAAVLVTLLSITTSTAAAPTGASSGGEDTSTDEPAVPAQPVSPVQLAALPHASTFSTLTGAPADPDPADAPSGRVVHPSTTVPVYSAPGGAAIAALPTQQLGSDTWVPVVAGQPGWVQVLLPSRPNGATGWLVLDEHLQPAHTSYRVEVDRAAFTLRLLREDQVVGQWPIGIGKPVSPTPAGRTFVLASIREIHPTFSPIILPLGTHSDTYTSYGGGPGTVGLHTWPTPSVYGTAASDGCVRVPPDALEVLATELSLGSPVLIH